jgi:L(+)-tartrate dehydratase alpha subunit
MPGVIPAKLVEDTARELMARAAIDIPPDYRAGVRLARDREQNKLARFVLTEMDKNWDIAQSDRRPMCADTGLPRYYVRAGNEAVVEGGFVALERALRRATADATAQVPLRPNRVHPLTRVDHNNNVGIHAPEVTFAFEPDADWIDVTTVHKGGLFGSDYRMLFPSDGIPGIKRFFVDTLVEFGHRGLSCPPVIVGVGIGGTKDQCVTLGKEASCLRLVGDRHPDPLVAKLELELLELGNRTMIGIMGFKSDTPVLDVHCEIAYAHTGGLPIGISELCHAVRRATARIYNDGRVEYREDPQWFTPYYRREGIEYVPGESQPSTKGGEGIKGLAELGKVSGVRSQVSVSDGHLTPDTRHPTPSREWHLSIPLKDKDVRLLRAGDVVYLTGCIFTARDGVFKYMIDEGHEPPIQIRDMFNVTTQSSPAGTEVSPGKYMVNSLQATAGFRYAQWMDRLFERHGVKAVLNKGGMSQEMYQTVFKKHGVVCLSTMPYGIGAIYGKAVTGVRDVYWKDRLGMSEGMWLLEVEELGPLLVDGDSEGNSYVADHAEEVNAPLLEIYKELPELILKRFGEVSDPTQELIK